MKFVDQDGEWVHIVIGAAIGGVVNLGIKAYQGNIHSWKDGFVAFGVGSVAGAVGAATGGAAFVAAGGGAAGAGGFIAGSVGSMVGTALASPLQNIGNHLYFGDPLMTPKEFLMGVAISGVIGGTLNGATALFNGKTFWGGSIKPSVQLQPQTTAQITAKIKIDEPEPSLQVNSETKVLELPPVKNEDGIYNLNGVRTKSYIEFPKNAEVRILRDPTFREALIEASGVNPGSSAQAHHIFPIQFARNFARAGIDPNGYGAWWSASTHSGSAAAYNKAWRLFFDIYKNANFDQVYQHAKYLKALFGY